MEFSSLTKRVGEATGIDPNAIDPDPALSADRGTGGPPESIEPTAPIAPAGAAGPADASTVADAPAGAERAMPTTAARQLSLGLPPVASNRKPLPAGRSEGTTPLTLVRERLAEAQKVDRTAHETITDTATLARFIAEATDQGYVAIDLVLSSPDPMIAALIGVSLALAPNRAAYLPLGHRAVDDLLAAPSQSSSQAWEGKRAGGGLVPGQVGEHEALALLKPMLEDRAVLKIGHDLKADTLVLDRHGIALGPIDDVMLMSYVLDAGRGGHTLDELAHRHFGHAVINQAEIIGKGRAQVPFATVEIVRACPYCAENPDISLRLWRLFTARLVAEHMMTPYQSLERPLVAVLARMERRGISIDSDVLSRLSGDFAQKSAALDAEIQEIAGEPLNPGSPKQIGDVLFGKMKFPGGRKTKTGAWSTSASVLDDLAEEGHLLPTRILEWRQVSKLQSTYTDLLPSFVNPDTGRVHTNFALASTTTGRLSSFDPNLQNIPIRTEEGRKIRRAFIAAPGMQLVSADYSQIELRLLAEIADIAALKRAFRDHIDIHALTASEMFGVPVAGMPGEVRRRAKAINFGIIYGISAFGLANQLGISREEASAYIKRYFERFPGIRAYIEATKQACRENGYVTTLFGRKCHYPDIAASNPSIRSFNERAAVNARLQGTAADIIRRAMVRMDDALAKERLSAQMLLQVHDELVFELPPDEIARTLPVIKRVMEEAPLPAVNLSVPLQVDARAAGNWDAAH
jgi:DNA polymerase-1